MAIACDGIDIRGQFDTGWLCCQFDCSGEGPIAANEAGIRKLLEGWCTGNPYYSFIRYIISLFDSARVNLLGGAYKKHVFVNQNCGLPYCISRQ